MLESPEGLEQSIDENFCKISDTPSRYQMGKERYIGGAIRKRQFGLVVATDSMMLWTSLKMGSTLMEMDDPSSVEPVRKLVTQDRRTTLELSRT